MLAHARACMRVHATRRAASTTVEHNGRRINERRGGGRCKREGCVNTREIALMCRTGACLHAHARTRLCQSLDFVRALRQARLQLPACGAAVMMHMCVNQ